MLDYLKRAVNDGASDLFLIAGGPVSEKQDKHLIPISEGRVFPKETSLLLSQLYAQACRSMDGSLSRGDDDFSFSVPGLARFRVNAYRQRGSLAAVESLVDQAGGNVVGRMAILAEGDALDRKDITVLGPLPVFNADGSIKG